MAGREAGARLIAALCLSAGASVGVMLLFAPDVAIAAPLLLVLGAVAAGQWSAGRFAQAGWLLFGNGLAILAAWILVLVRGLPPELDGDLPFEVVVWLAAGGGPLLLGLGLIARREPAARAPDMAAAADGQARDTSARSRPRSGSRAWSARSGCPSSRCWSPSSRCGWRCRSGSDDAHFVVQIGLPSLISAVIAAEAYVRAMPPRSRRAFEAFSWLGEWELARARATTGRSVPTSPDDAGRWLAERPERIDKLEEAALRVEVLPDRRIDEARALVERMEPARRRPGSGSRSRPCRTSSVGALVATATCRAWRPRPRQSSREIWTTACEPR